MADTSYPVGSQIAVMYWHRKLYREALKQTWLSKFIGPDSNSMIQFLDETNKGPGDTIRVLLRSLLTGDGIQGDGTLVGNEEEMAVNVDNVLLNQIRHAVRSGGKMSEQRIPYEVREECYLGLRDWWSKRYEVSGMNQLAGNTNQSSTLYSGNNATIAPATNNWLFAGPGDTASEASVTTSASSYFRLSDVDRMVLRAKTLARNPIRPFMVDGEEKYVLLIHPYQHYQLRTNGNTGQYLDIQKAAMTGGQITKNPLYTGAIAEWNGCIIHEAPYACWGSAQTAADRIAVQVGQANVARAVLAGAQAMAFCTGQNTSGPNAEPNWYEELFDYGNKLGVAGGMIFGMKKMQFTPPGGSVQDLSTVVLSSFSPDPS